MIYFYGNQNLAKMPEIHTRFILKIKMLKKSICQYALTLGQFFDAGTQDQKKSLLSGSSRPSLPSSWLSWRSSWPPPFLQESVQEEAHHFWLYIRRTLF